MSHHPNGAISNIVLTKACEHWKITELELRSPRRDNETAERRFIVYLILHDLGYSYPFIGKLIPHHNGKYRDHTAIMHGVRAIQSWLKCSTTKRMKRAKTDTQKAQWDYQQLKKAISQTMEGEKTA